MSTATTPRKTVAFFGATGGCTLACLVRALEAGHDCIALARTPSKLTGMLVDRGIGPTALDTHLTIVPGDAKDSTAVSEALQRPGGPTGELVDLVISGVGGFPVLQWSLMTPVTLTDPGLCAGSARALTAAIKESRPPSGRRPLVAAISTTGLSRRQRDVPWLMYPMYHWLLHVPHADKWDMERELNEQLAGSACVVRPSLLLDGAGNENVRVGWEALDGLSDGGGQVAVGYTVSRESVGRWIFEELVKSDGAGKWSGRAVTLTD